MDAEFVTLGLGDFFTIDDLLNNRVRVIEDGEAQPQGNESFTYSVESRQQDGSFAPVDDLQNQVFTIVVNAVNDAPTKITPSTTRIATAAWANRADQDLANDDLVSFVIEDEEGGTQRVLGAEVDVQGPAFAAMADGMYFRLTVVPQDNPDNLDNDYFEFVEVADANGKTRAVLRFKADYGGNLPRLLGESYNVQIEVIDKNSGAGEVRTLTSEIMKFHVRNFDIDWDTATQDIQEEAPVFNLFAKQDVANNQQFTASAVFAVVPDAYIQVRADGSRQISSAPQNAVNVANNGNHAGDAGVHSYRTIYLAGENIVKRHGDLSPDMQVRVGAVKFNNAALVFQDGFGVIGRRGAAGATANQFTIEYFVKDQNAIESGCGCRLCL